MIHLTCVFSTLWLGESHEDFAGLLVQEMGWTLYCVHPLELRLTGHCYLANATAKRDQ